jgi:hypothetical protein
MGRITTKTADRLQSIAQEITAIAEAVYVAGHHRLASEIATTASALAGGSLRLRSTIEAEAREMMRDDPS